MGTKYKKGQILNVDLQKIDCDTKALYGEHRVVVLHHKPSPYNVTLVAPVTTASSLQERGNIPNTYVPLLRHNYPMLLHHDSYVCLDAVVAIDSDKLNQYSKGSFKIDATLSDDDMLDLDMKLVLKFELDNYLDICVKENIKEVVLYIDDCIKESVSKLHKIIKEEEVLVLTIDVFKEFMSEIKETYKIKENV